jgi:CheY-like chemotaxis protein
VLFAEHGQRALELIDKEGVDAFDVVLTDIQMPVMDGYELAAKVRTLSSSLPVIGLTAHVLQDELARSAEAGFRTLITKPIDEHQLVSVVVKHLVKIPNLAPTPELPNQEEPVCQVVNARADSLIDWEALAERYQGRAGFSERILGIFVRTHCETASKLRQALQDGNMDAVRQIAHTLHGIAGSIEAVSLGVLASSLENALIEDGDVAGLGLRLAGSLQELIEMLRTRSERVTCNKV